MKSLLRDKKIFNFIRKLHQNKKKIFTFKVKIPKSNYIRMLKKRYISTLLTLTDQELQNGISEINCKYKKSITFTDKLICLIL